MAPYSPPTGGRADMLRLDFNENTIGCSPRVTQFIAENLTENDLAVYPEYTDARRELSEFFQVPEDEMLFTNGTDEAIQVLVNTYVRRRRGAAAAPQLCDVQILFGSGRGRCARN